jgi:outer membrane protein OmpA-like peptidoglycan-associated protein
MLQFLKMRIPLIGLGFLILAGCSESASDKARIDAADPGTRPYPNLGAFPPVPARVSASKVEAEQKALLGQREAARDFDARLRAIDPVLDPAARPPEPPNLSGSAAPIPDPSPAPVSAPAPVAAAPAVVAAVPVAPAPAPVPAVVAPIPAPAPVPANRPALRPVPPPAPAPVVAAALARNAWIVGDIDFVAGSTLLLPEARRTLRDAVIAAQERGGRVRVIPAAGQTLSPPEQALSPRRAAAASGELEALGLDRARIVIDAGVLKAARVAVEF